MSDKSDKQSLQSEIAFLKNVTGFTLVNQLFDFGKNTKQYVAYGTISECASDLDHEDIVHELYLEIGVSRDDKFEKDA